jgi:glycosyltransferase involved in cell wall biosynthesis
VRILIATTHVPFSEAGGDSLVEGLRQAVVSRGHQADVACLPFCPTAATVAEQTIALRLLDLTETCGNPIDRLIAVGFPATALHHPNKLAWLVPVESDSTSEGGHRPLYLLQRAESIFAKECRKVYAASRAHALHSERCDGVLYAPLPHDPPYRPGAFGDHLLVFARWAPIEHLRLAIAALRHAPPVQLILGASNPEDTSELLGFAQELGLSDRVRVMNEAEADRLAECSGVLHLPEPGAPVFPLEAFQSAKPVIVLEDAGPGGELIEHGENGWVVPAAPQPLGEAMLRLWQDRPRAEEMGRQARETLQRHNITWDHVVEKLTA